MSTRVSAYCAGDRYHLSRPPSDIAADEILVELDAGWLVRNEADGVANLVGFSGALSLSLDRALQLGIARVIRSRDDQA
jgi:hypothetical protein